MSDRSARVPARPRHDSADIRRDCPARSESVRSLPASIGRGSRACARTSWVWCRALRLALALALGTRHSHSALALGTRTRHSHSALALGTRTRHSHSALALGTRHSHSHSALGTQPRPSDRWTDGPMDTCRHRLVSSKRPKTPQPSSRGAVRADQFRRADDSAHIRSTCRLAAQSGRGGCAEHPDSLSRKLRAAHPDLGVASSASGGRRPLPVPTPSIPGLDSSDGSQCSPRDRTDSLDRRRCRRRELDPARRPTRGVELRSQVHASMLTAHTSYRSPRCLHTLSASLTKFLGQLELDVLGYALHLAHVLRSEFTEPREHALHQALGR